MIASFHMADNGLRIITNLSSATDRPVLLDSAPRIPNALSLAFRTNAAGHVSENDGVQLALVVGLAGIVLAL